MADLSVWKLAKWQCDICPQRAHSVTVAQWAFDAAVIVPALVIALRASSIGINSGIDVL
jgi:hypothetical protein